MHLPDALAPWKKRVRSLGDAEAAFNISLVERVRLDRLRGRKGGSFVDMLLARRTSDPESLSTLDERALATLPATLFSGGVDTTVSTIHSAILLLLLHPEVLARARREIDEYLLSVGGEGRSPTFADLPNLPYLNALIQEILRFRPAIPLMIPRATVAADEYHEYSIPKGTTIFVNTHAIHNLPQYFPFPEIFAPQRFLDEDHRWWEERYRGETFPGKYRQGVFGWGRRSCPGAELAVNGIGILLAKVVWGFEILREEGGGNGGKRLEDVGYEGGIIQKPEKFGVVFKVRGKGVERVVGRERVVAEGVLRGVEAWE
jgi:cytochrome P450